jgi:hypothetical protein
MANIPLSQLEQMFRNMQTEAGWDTEQELLWGYFFMDAEAGHLQPLARKLEEMGYRFVDLYPTDDGSTHVLHVERVERHSPLSLDRRNQELNALAKECGVESYDGMDVGPVSGASQ